MFTCLTLPARTIQCRAKMLRRLVVTPTKTTSRWCSAHRRDVSQLHAVVTHLARSMVCPQSDPPASTPQVYLTCPPQRAIHLRSLFQDQANLARCRLILLHGMDRARNVRAASSKHAGVALFHIQPKAVIDLIIRPVLDSQDATSASIGQGHTNHENLNLGRVPNESKVRQPQVSHNHCMVSCQHPRHLSVTMCSQRSIDIANICPQPCLLHIRTRPSHLELVIKVCIHPGQDRLC